MLFVVESGVKAGMLDGFVVGSCVWAENLVVVGSGVPVDMLVSIVVVVGSEVQALMLMWFVVGSCVWA